MPLDLTGELVRLLAKRTRLMADVAAQKADFALVFDAGQELEVLKAAREAATLTTLSPVGSVVFAQILADCAKQEQEAHLQAAVDAAEAAGEAVEAEGDQEGYYGMLTSEYESLEDVRVDLADLNHRVLELWQLAAQPGGEWDQAGCACAQENLAALFISEFQPAAVGGCGEPLFSEMLIWALLSASASCRAS